MPGAGTSRPATALTALAVAAAVWVLATAVGSIGTAALAAAAGALVGAATLLRARPTPVRTGVATVLAIPGALTAAGAVGLAAREAGAASLVSGSPDLVPLAAALVGALGVVTAAALGAFGTVGTLADGIGDGAVTRLWASVVASLTVLVAALGLVLAPRVGALSALPAPAVDLSPVVDPVLSPSGAWIGLATFGILAGALAAVARWAIGVAPIVELASRTRRERVEAALERASSLLAWATWGAFLLAVLSAAAVGAALPTSSIEGLHSLLGSPGVRTALVGLIAVFTAISLLLTVLRAAAGSVTGSLRRLLPSAAGGGVGVAFAVAAAPLVPSRIADLPPAARDPARDVVRALSPLGVVLAVVVFATFALALVLVAVALAGAFRYVPPRAGGGAIAAGGVGIGAIAAGVAGAPALTVFAAVALAVLAWDASERGVTTRAELGARPPVHVEVVHALGAVAVAALAVGLAWVLRGTVVDAANVAGGNVVALLAAVAATLVLVAGLRG